MTTPGKEGRRRGGEREDGPDESVWFGRKLKYIGWGSIGRGKCKRDQTTFVVASVSKRRQGRRRGKKGKKREEREKGQRDHEPNYISDFLPFFPTFLPPSSL